MKKNLLFVLGILILAVGIFYLSGKFYSNQKKETEVITKIEQPQNKSSDLNDKNSLLISTYSPSMGPTDAPVTIVEFLDPECESCRAFYPEVKNILNEYKGQIRFIVRYMPFHKNSMLAANSLEAARDQGKYWEALDLLFKTQEEWGSHSNPQPEKIEKILSTLGLEMKTFRETVKKQKHSWKIIKDREMGEELGVRGTPTFFINGKILENLDYMFFKATIEESLSENKK